MTKLRYQLTDADRKFCQRVVCAGFHEIKYHTLQVVMDLLDDGIEGDFAECGVLYGAMPAIMLYAMRNLGVTDRKVHLFDSFQGIPRATLDDPEPQQRAYGLSSGSMESSGVSACSVEQVMNNLRDWGCRRPEEFVVIHAGWFQDTLPMANIGKLALLRSDVDLYESTKCVYRHLYGKVVHGGYVVDDDWGVPGDVTACRRAVLEIIPSRDVDQIEHVEGQNTTAWWRRP